MDTVRDTPTATIFLDLPGPGHMRKVQNFIDKGSNNNNNNSDTANVIECLLCTNKKTACFKA